MRELALLILLAAAASPALAAPEDRGSRRDRPDASERAEMRAHRASASEDGPSDRPSGVMRSQQDPQPSFSAQRERFQQRQRESEQVSTRAAHNDPVRIRRRSEAGVEGAQAQASLRPRERRIRTIPNTSPIEVQKAETRTGGFHSGAARSDYLDGKYTRWSTTHWRGDHRYDWRRYRDRHRSLFRLGFYHDPFGWSYRRWYTGSYLYPSYYGSNFWLNDPWYYRLPHAYGPYRWVRYWNDALLVNVYTGEVVDVIRSFFW